VFHSDFQSTILFDFNHIQNSTSGIGRGRFISFSQQARLFNASQKRALFEREHRNPAIRITGVIQGDLHRAGNSPLISSIRVIDPFIGSMAS
jgi:hypothetical protein